MNRERVALMKTAAVVATVFLTLSLLGPASAEEWPVTPARLSLIEGEVLVQTPESPEWFPASSNLPLGPGDRIHVGAGGKAEIQLPEGNVARLGSETSVDLRSLSHPGALESRIGLERGVAFFYLGPPQSSRGAFLVELPQASLRPSHPSSFRSELFPDGSMQVSVHSGEVIVQTPGGVSRVHGRQSLRLGPDFRPHLFALAQGDDFDRWNNLRELELSRAARSPYLPRDLGAYAADFGAYGRWVELPDNGYGWAPVVEAGWTPFSGGRWIWWRGEHVWVPDEPWGWAPHHYGRWQFSLSIGWVWFPPVATAVIWHPGAVAWHYGPEFVAWIPLAPGEIYYGRRHYGPWSVNVTNVHVNNVQVTNVFVNARAKKSVVVVHKETFLTGRRAPASFVPPRDLFASGGHRSLGPPALRPTMAARRPTLSRSITTSEVQPRAIEPAVRGIGATPRAADTNRALVSPEREPRRAVPDTLRALPAPPSPIRPVERGEAATGSVVSPSVRTQPNGSSRPTIVERRTDVAPLPTSGRTNGDVTSRRGQEDVQLRSAPTRQSPAPPSRVAPARQDNPVQNSRQAEVTSSRTSRGESALPVREGRR